MRRLSFLQIRNPKDDESPIEGMVQVFSSLSSKRGGFWKTLFFGEENFSFEVYLRD